jgi:SNF2 family DNA or RNA helicase
MIRVIERVPNKLPGLSSLFISFDFNRRIVDELKLLNNSHFNPETKEWEVPVTSLSELLDRLCIIDDISMQFMETPKEKTPTEVDINKYKTRPFDYQLEGIKYGLSHDSWLLLDAPGLGKTLQLTYLAQELREKRGVQHCLIVCGINTLKTNWKSEIEKHSDLPCMILGQRINKRGRLVIDGIPNRLKQLQSPINEFFVITNVETLREEKIVKALLKNKPNKFDMIIFDEIHTCKSPSSIQGKNLLKLTKAPFRIGATGTLLLNNPLDAYVPLKWIGAENANYTNFKYYYCNYGGPFNNQIVGFRNLSTLKSQLEEKSLRRTKDILSLPEKMIINEFVDMSDSQESFYENIKNGIIEQVDKVKMSTVNLLAMVTRLRQATACPSILTTENIPSAKMDRAIDLTDQIVSSGDKVVIFSTFKETADRLANALQDYGVVKATGDNSDDEIERAKYAFQNDDNVKVFIGTWQKCGTGITLTAASYMIFLDTPWTDSVYTQAQDRIYRIGTKKSVTIYNLIAKDTIDERVLEIVNDKKAIANYVVDDEITQEGLDSLRKYIEELF